MPDRAPVLRRNKRLNLRLGQPLELLVTEHTLTDVGLASHDACLHEEDLLAEFLLLVGVAEGGFAGFVGLVVGELADLRAFVVVVVVGDGVVADDPGVHVEAGGLHDDALGGLGSWLVSSVVWSGYLEHTWFKSSLTNILSSGNLHLPSLLLTIK